MLFADKLGMPKKIKDLADSIMVPAIRFFSAAVAFFLVASWSVTGWEKPSPSQP